MAERNCDTCKGSGWSPPGAALAVICPDCKGWGTIDERKR